MPHANNEGGNTTDGMEVDTYGDFEIYDLIADRHEDVDIKERLPELFDELKSCVAHEHADYIATEAPGGQVY